MKGDMLMFTITITKGGKTTKEKAFTKDFAVGRAKSFEKLGAEVEVRDQKYGLIYF